MKRNDDGGGVACFGGKRQWWPAVVPGGGWRLVVVGDRIDPGKDLSFHNLGLAGKTRWKSPPEKFSGGRRRGKRLHRKRFGDIFTSDDYWTISTLSAASLSVVDRSLGTDTPTEDFCHKLTMVHLNIENTFGVGKHPIQLGTKLVKVFAVHELKFMPPRRLRRIPLGRIVERRVAKALKNMKRLEHDLKTILVDLVSTKYWRDCIVPVIGCSYKNYELHAHSFKGTDRRSRTVVCPLTWWTGKCQTLGLANANQIPGQVKAMMTTEYAQHRNRLDGARTLDSDSERKMNIRGNLISSKLGDLVEAYQNMGPCTGLEQSVQAESECGHGYVSSLNDHYACILFDSGAEKSFVSSAFTPFIDIAPTALNTNYEIELADGKVVSTNTILCSCTLVLLNHVFKIDLLPTQLGSFDVIIGMDWLAYYRALIDCYEKIVRIPLPNGEILEVQGERPEKDLGSLACIKADEKKLDDIRIVRDFPEVFPDDLLGLPHVREVEFRIDLIPWRSTVVRSPYRLAPSEMLELSNQLKNFTEKGFIRPSTQPWGSTCALFEEVQFLATCGQRTYPRGSSKVESVKNWKTPESPTEIRSFLGLAGYYRRFIENFSKIAKPLTLLTQKNKAYVWGDKQEEAFQILKEKLCNAPVLALPDGPVRWTLWSL
ncbi:putative reverse transcriptase domain-containing protein [Tanacetum coccineum]